MREQIEEGQNAALISCYTHTTRIGCFHWRCMWWATKQGVGSDWSPCPFSWSLTAFITLSSMKYGKWEIRWLRFHHAACSQRTEAPQLACMTAWHYIVCVKFLQTRSQFNNCCLADDRYSRHYKSQSVRRGVSSTEKPAATPPSSIFAACKHQQVRMMTHVIHSILIYGYIFSWI